MAEKYACYCMETRPTYTLNMVEKIELNINSMYVYVCVCMFVRMHVCVCVCVYPGM